MKNDGGPVFPIAYEHSLGEGLGTVSQRWQGMSLRDYFAAAALQVIRHRLTINADAHDGGCTVDQIGDALCEGFVKTAYQVADAMIRARDL